MLLYIIYSITLAFVGFVSLDNALENLTNGYYLNSCADVLIIVCCLLMLVSSLKEVLKNG